MEIIFAILLGFAFGFVLQKIGAANPQRIINMLRLKDFHLMKAIFTGIGLSSLVLFSLMAAGLMDIGHLSIKTSYYGVTLGGAIMGIGWAISGFCPGTGVVAAGARRKDALVFVLGGLTGTLLFIWSYGAMQSTVLFEKIAGGKSTLADTGLESCTALLPTVPPLLIAGGIGIVFILIAWKLPKGSRAE